ncbi:MAG: DinB family protein [Balneolaceae bacterium]|nr:DinB family protein [Balneolaceae bacterium]
MHDQSKVREHLLEQLRGKNAHIDLQRAVKDIPFKDIGRRPQGLPYSVWEQVEHIRISQYDIVQFSLDPEYDSPSWPEGYWPANASPPSQERWEEALQAIEEDHRRMIELVEDSDNDLFKPFPHGDGQTLFREAMLIVDHNAYHVGQIVVIRRLLGNW